MDEPLTKAALDLAISLIQSSVGAPLDPSGVYLMQVDPWSYEYLLADRRKARRMRRRLKLKQEG